MLAVVDAHVVNGDDVRVLEERRGRDLAPEPLNDLLARELPGQNHLHRDNALELKMPRAIDHAHPAAGNLFEQFVIAEVPGRPIFDFGFSIFEFWRKRRVSGAGNLRFLVRLFQAALQQATSAKTLGVLRAQFGPATGA